MKKTLFQFIIVGICSILLISCSKKDSVEEEPIDPFTEIYGHWKFNTRGLYNYQTGASIDTEDVTNWGWTDIIFYDDGEAEWYPNENSFYTWKSVEYPNHVFMEDIYFKWKTLGNDTLVLYRDPNLDSNNPYDENIAWGYLLIRVLP